MLKREDKFNREFKSTPGKVAYHIPCHYRAQNIGYRSRDMMKTIGQTQFQVLLNILDFDMGIQEAIEAPRIGLSAKPNFYKRGAELTMRAEGRISPQILARLKEMGHHPEVAAEFAIGNMQGILMNLETNTMTAGADPRRMMYAVGW